MCEFYGFEVVDAATGELVRAKNCRERFRNINDNPHNLLRISRILQSLGQMGFKRYKVLVTAPWTADLFFVLMNRGWGSFFIQKMKNCLS